MTLKARASSPAFRRVPFGGPTTRSPARFQQEGNSAAGPRCRWPHLFLGAELVRSARASERRRAASPGERQRPACRDRNCGRRARALVVPPTRGSGRGAAIATSTRRRLDHRPPLAGSTACVLLGMSGRCGGPLPQPGARYGRKRVGLGYNAYGRLGDGTTTGRPAPVRFRPSPRPLSLRSQRAGFTALRWRRTASCRRGAGRERATRRRNADPAHAACTGRPAPGHPIDFDSLRLQRSVDADGVTWLGAGTRIVPSEMALLSREPSSGSGGRPEAQRPIGGPSLFHVHAARNIAGDLRSAGANNVGQLADGSLIDRPSQCGGRFLACPDAVPPAPITSSRRRSTAPSGPGAATPTVSSARVGTTNPRRLLSRD